MSTGAADPYAARQLFTALFDDAALFPPGNAPMVLAVPAHLGYHARPEADLIGPFLCPASRLGELAVTMADEPYLDLRVVVDTGTGGLADAVAALTGPARAERYQGHGFELALRAEADLGIAARRLVAAVCAAELPSEISVFVEVPIASTTKDALDVLAEYDVLAKLRTGGADQAAHPSETAVADFLVACLDREIAFKCTAGLHHAVRTTDRQTGFDQHGFLNILLAVSSALAGADPEQVAAELADRDMAGVADRVRQLSDDQATRIRRWFRSFGTCSIEEPLAELIGLGLVPESRLTAIEQPG
jgi:hypothetical protein